MTATMSDVAVTALRDRVRDAATRGASLRIAGNGRWLDAGRPVRATETLPTRELAGIVEYVPGDLTLTARAGTTLAEIREATSPHNQWLALDPHGDDEGTLGATVATASAGPLATHFGTPRDLVLGAEFVSGAGAVVRGGGRVVKNVAGFDLTRLIIGSWGTLGVLTEITVRLHARPASDVTCAARIDPSHVGRVRTLLRRLPFTPFACEVLNTTLAQRLLGRAETTVLFRLGGNADDVAAQRTALAELGELADVNPAVWTGLRSADADALAVVRLSDSPSNIESTWSASARIDGALVHASPARGIVRAIVPVGHAAATAVSDVPAGMTVIGERLPASLWARVPFQRGALPPRIKAAFDPSNVLNPGILGITA